MTTIRRAITLLPALTLLTAYSLAQAPPAFTTLFNFPSKTEGGNPQTGLVMGNHGQLYGTTNLGGTLNLGTVFELTPPAAAGEGWTENVIHNFHGTPDGSYPDAILTVGSNGVVYGETEGGGIGYFGTVFELAPPTTPGEAWTETVLYTFPGGSSGYYPAGGLFLATNGTLYGVAEFGGAACSCGTVFELTPPATPGGAWAQTTLYTFQADADGADPQGGLVMSLNGTLYGTTYRGGIYGYGTAFQLTPPASPGGAWRETVLHTFSGSQLDGSKPMAGLILGNGGALYGTASSGGLLPACSEGCGMVFKLTPPGPDGTAWTEHIVYTFSGFPIDGQNPVAPLAFGENGILYGTTEDGGTGTCSPDRVGLPGCGTVFQLTPAVGGTWTETILHNFMGASDGARPFGGVAVGPSGNLFGTASQSGKLGICCGTVFALTP
jgi:hypothetical protein